ncbi:malonate decarboxylase subunit delta [Bordetella sp. H567]|uniref:malonate decarboxylase acyl carrier protein n=1 Tax=Bordetella sp. H567 TaxID=1697043 RepID=UPI00081CAC63|nr:malonate decarboxylase acyl carrier protein [Bordetella sp. H567]AOB32892.1 malonate decarboxylase subunit delta [Bordetella sp. H567]
METFTRRYAAQQRFPGGRDRVLVGVVASGNLEVLAERIPGNDDTCHIHVSTAVKGFGDVWEAVLADFVERYATGGVVFSINDGGARPDTVMLRLAQACEALKETT